MVKLGKTRYQTDYGLFTAMEIIRKFHGRKPCKYNATLKCTYLTIDVNTATEIIRKFHGRKLCKYNATLKCTYLTIDVKFARTTVRLFFCKRGRNGQWNGLLTTDLGLSFLRAYRIYSMRWATEEAYHDEKPLFGFGKCQSVHFSAQMAGITLAMMQYNIMCTVSMKRSVNSSKRLPGTL